MQVIEAQCSRSWRPTITLHINQKRMLTPPAWVALFWTSVLGWKIPSEPEPEIVIGTDKNVTVAICAGARRGAYGLTILPERTIVQLLEPPIEPS